MITDGCTRTKEIKNDNFIVKQDFDPDFGRDETLVILDLIKSDTTEKFLSQYDSILNFKNKILEDKVEESLKKLANRTIWLFSVLFTTLTIIALLIFQKRRQKG